MTDPTSDSNNEQNIVPPVIAPDSIKPPIQEIPTLQPQFLTISYNPAAHPRQIFLLDANGQPVQYTLMPPNQNIPVQPNNVTAMPPPMNTLFGGNACCICGSIAASKCTYGISRGQPCGRLLCLTHVNELPDMSGRRVPHCPEHYQFVRQNKCHIL